MPKPDNLLQLIKSLDTNQRRYFKLFSNLQAGEKKYVQLFELLETKNDYNADVLSKQLDVSKPQLAVIKNYLTGALLKSIRIYKEDSDTDARLMAVAQNAEELIRLSLFDFALQILDKAIDEAWRDERFELLPKLLWVKHSCLYTSHQFILAADVNKECVKVINIYSEFQHLRAMQAEVCLAWLNQSPAQKYKKLVAQLEKNTRKLSFRATVEVYLILIFYYHALKPDAGKLMKVVRQGIAYYEEKPHMLKLHYGNYLGLYDKLAVAEFTAKNYEQCQETNKRALHLANAAPKSVQPAFLQQFVQSRHIKSIEIYLAINQYDKALEVLKDQYSSLDQFSPYFKAYFLYYYAMALIHVNRPLEANDRLNDILSLPDRFFMAIHARVRMALVLVQLDMENYEVVPYLIRTAKAWIRRKKLSNPEIELFFKLTYSIAKASSNKRNARWEEFAKALKNNDLPQLNGDEGLDLWLQKNRARHKSRLRSL